MSGRSITAAVACLVVAGGTVVAGAGPAHAVPPVAHDLIAVGVPDADAGAGAVDVHYPDGTQQRLTEETLGLAGQVGFGRSVTSADLNNDGVTDLVVGAAERSLRDSTTGRTWLLFGGVGGFTTGRVRELDVVDAAVGDRFGYAVATTRTPFGRDVWVGAPGATVNGHIQAGAVHRYTLDDSGAPTRHDVVTQDGDLVPGRAENRDRFGLVLAPTGDGVVVGDPNESIGSKPSAGAIYRLRTSRTTNALIGAQSLNQDSAGVAGTAESGDLFGSALSADGRLVGVPGEGVGNRHPSAGMVQVFGLTSDDRLRPVRSITQDTARVPGVSETGDRFGAAVTTGFSSYCDSGLQAVIGVPGESVGTVRNAGRLVFEPLVAVRGCDPTSVHQHTGLPGRPEEGDEVGAALSTVNGDLEGDPQIKDAVLIGVPNESVDGVEQAGRAVLIQAPDNARSFGPIGGDVAQQYFGGVLGLDAD